MAVSNVIMSITDDELEACPRLRELTYEISPLMSSVTSTRREVAMGVGGAGRLRELRADETELGRKFYERERIREERRVARVVEEEADAVRRRRSDGDDDEEDDICPICLDPLPPETVDFTESEAMICCGNFICSKCGKQREGMVQSALLEASTAPDGYARASAANESERLQECPLCRTPLPGPDEELLELFTKQAERGKPWAQHSLGQKYMDGEDYVKEANPKEGMKWLTRASEQGYQFAQYHLAVQYHNGEKVGKDVKKARRWYAAAADQGHSAAQFSLGEFLMEGLGGKKEEEAGVRMLTLSAAHGNVDGMTSLAQAHEFGEGGLVQNNDRSLYWSSRAAGKGSARGYSRLSQVLLNASSRWHGRYDHAATGCCPLPMSMRLARKARALGVKEITQNGYPFDASIVETVEEAVNNDECAGCGKLRSSEEEPFKKCTRCKAAYYCAKDCQRCHWKRGHKVDCSFHWYVPLLGEKIFEA